MVLDMCHTNSALNFRKTHHQFHVPYNVWKQSIAYNWNMVAFKINYVHFIVPYQSNKQTDISWGEKATEQKIQVRAHVHYYEKEQFQKK